MRQARGMKLLAVAGAVVITLGIAACGGGDSGGSGSGTTEKKKVKVGLAFDIGGRGDKSFNDAAALGLDKAKTELDVETRDLSAAVNESENDKYERLRLLCTGGYNPVIAVGFVYHGADAKTGPVAKAAKECPDTKFAIVDGAGVEGTNNLAGLTFAEEQGSYLVGAAAALKTKTGTVGFVGGCDVTLIKKFEAGFKAGVEKAKPGTKVLTNYLSTPADKCSGFNDPAKGQTQAEGMYDQGADIVYQAAGGSGTGVFKAAKAKGKLAIGVDSDQYNTVEEGLKEVIITSMLKRVDVAVYDFIKSIADNKFVAGTQSFDLKKDGVGYSTTGGKVDDIKTKLDEYKQQIIGGTISVPTAPAA